jgi:hypothetical protein
LRQSQNTPCGSVALSLRAQLHIAFALTNNGTLCLIGRKGSQSRKNILPKLKRAQYLYTNGDKWLLQRVVQQLLRYFFSEGLACGVLGLSYTGTVQWLS